MCIRDRLSADPVVVAAKDAAAAGRDVGRASRQVVEAHLAHFRRAEPRDDDTSYEAWIAELHPDNVCPKSRGVDARFYLEESYHRRIWNRDLPKDSPRLVRASPPRGPPPKPDEPAESDGESTQSQGLAPTRLGVPAS